MLCLVDFCPSELENYTRDPHGNIAYHAATALALLPTHRKDQHNHEKTHQKNSMKRHGITGHAVQR